MNWTRLAAVVIVMLKDSKKYASTGGWGFEAWADGDPKKALVTDPANACFECHTPRKANQRILNLS
jgi:hypothetical protein